jgi:2-hydroxy-3-keto-5-methylthiopentenyl-1-phosphate phosphatase
MLFIIDFDGTVAPTDTVDDLLDRFADPDWRRIEQQWVNGEISSRRCMAEQIAMVSGNEQTLRRFLSSVAIDPAFPEFVHYASTFADLAIVSDGLDFPIQQALRRLGLPDLPVFANHVELRQSGLGLTFPYYEKSCTVGSGVCKCSVARAVDAGRELTTVLIGDGRSDQCVANQARYVFAKGSLITYCRETNISHIPFNSFADVLATIKSWDILPYQRRLKERQCPLLKA